MLECFLLLRHASGGKWVPLFAIPLVIAGGVASVSLMLSGLKGLLAARHPSDHPPRRSDGPKVSGLWPHAGPGVSSVRQRNERARQQYLTSNSG